MSHSGLTLANPVSLRAHRALPLTLWLSLLIHAAALGLLLYLSRPATPPPLGRSPSLSLILTTPAQALASVTVTKPHTSASPPRAPVAQRRARTQTAAATPPQPAPSETTAVTEPAVAATATESVTAPAPSTGPVTGLSAGKGTGFAFSRPRHQSPWMPQAVAALPPPTPPQAMNQGAAASFQAALGSALTAMLTRTAAPDTASNVSCQLTVSTRALTCTDPRWRDWIAAKLVWEQLPPPEVFGQPPSVALNIGTLSNGQITVSTLL